MEHIDYKFTRHNARNAQHVYFMEEILGAIPESIAVELGFNEPRAKLAHFFQMEKACFNRQRRFIQTDDMLEADKHRNTVYLFYKKITKVYRDYGTDAEKKEAARKVYFLFQETGWATRLDDMSKSAVFSALARDLQKEPYASALQLLGLEKASKELNDANQTYLSLVANRTAQVHSRYIASNMKEERPRVDRAFDLLAQSINAVYLTNELQTKNAEARMALLRIIKDVNRILLAFRRTIRLNLRGGKEDEETDTTANG